MTSTSGEVDTTMVGILGVDCLVSDTSLWTLLMDSVDSHLDTAGDFQKGIVALTKKLLLESSDISLSSLTSYTNYISYTNTVRGK